MKDDDSEKMKEIRAKIDELSDEDLLVYNKIVKMLSHLTHVSGVGSILLMFIFPNILFIMFMLWVLWWSFKVSIGSDLTRELIAEEIVARVKKR